MLTYAHIKVVPDLYDRFISQKCDKPGFFLPLLNNAMPVLGPGPDFGHTMC